MLQKKNPYPIHAQAQALKALGDSYLTKHEFKPGDLVQLKAGLNILKEPAYGEVAFVLEVQSGRRNSDTNSGGNHEYEPTEIRIGIISGMSEQFEGYWVDANRFEPYKN